MTTAIGASTYNVELRDKDGKLKMYLTPWVSKCSWEWNRIGGCGRASITIVKPYREIIFDALDDIQIRVKSGTTGKLVYRGYIANITPTLKVPQEVVLDVRGYFDLLKKIIIQSDDDVYTFSDDAIGEIVTTIADSFVDTKTSITVGSIDEINGSAFSIDEIDFLCTADEALRTLAEVAGDVEYGVDEDKVFYWRTESTTISRRFFVGDNVTNLERKVSYDNLVNKIYLIGGDVAGVKFKKTGEATDSQAMYYLVEEIINNSSIVTDGVAAQYITAVLTERSNPMFTIRAKVNNTAIRLEDTIPMGLVSFYDAMYDRDSPGDLIGDIIGEAADGGSDITIGLTADGGDDVIIGGQYAAQVNRVSYTPSNTPGRFNIEIELGDAITETSAKIKRLERELASLNQY